MCLLFSGFLACALFGMVPNARAADSMVDRVQAIIRARLDRDPATISLSCQGEMICGIQVLPLAYRDRKHLPLWIDASFRLEKAEALAEAIDHAGEDGLLPVDYHQDAIHELLAGAE